jgi:hypothetical protein
VLCPADNRIEQVQHSAPCNIFGKIRQMLPHLIDHPDKRRFVFGKMLGVVCGMHASHECVSDIVIVGFGPAWHAAAPG